MAGCFDNSISKRIMILILFFILSFNKSVLNDTHDDSVLMNRVKWLNLQENVASTRNFTLSVTSINHVDVCDYLRLFQPCLMFLHNGRYRFHTPGRRSWKSILTTLLLLLSGRVPHPGPARVNGLISLSYLNVNSMVRKGPLLHDLIDDVGCDVFVISETKLNVADTDFTRYGALPTGYSGIFMDRESETRGGGLAVLFRDTIKVTNKTANYAIPASCELLVVNVYDGSNAVTLVNIYRPPSSSLTLFLKELTDLIQELLLSGDRWIIGGDLNCPGETSETFDQGLGDILDMFNLKQWVTSQTHVRGGLLDLLITPVDVSYVQNNILIQSVGFTDHYMLSCNLNLRRVHQPVLEVKKQRSFKHFNVNQFKELLYKTEIVTDPADDVDEYVRQYNDSISTVLDKLAPLKTVTNRRGKKNNTWLSEDAKKAKRKRRRLERRWCRTKSERDRVAYRESCRTANTLIMDSRKNFYAELISNASDNMRSLWRTVNGILHPNVVVNIVGLSSKVLADYFISKVSKTIQTIRDKVNILHIVRCSDPRYEGKQMDTLTLVTRERRQEARDNEVPGRVKLISSLPNKTSPLDFSS